MRHRDLIVTGVFRACALAQSAIGGRATLLQKARRLHHLTYLPLPVDHTRAAFLAGVRPAVSPDEIPNRKACESCSKRLIRLWVQADESCLGGSNPGRPAVCHRQGPSGLLGGGQTFLFIVLPQPSLAPCEGVLLGRKVRRDCDGMQYLQS
jgi:hypothetical protein